MSGLGMSDFRHNAATPRRPDESGAASAMRAPPPSAPPPPHKLPPARITSKRTKPRLGDETEVYYEWWNVDLIKTLHARLSEDAAEAAHQVESEAVPWVNPDTGARRVNPTAAEKLLRKKEEYCERLRLMCTKFGKLEPEASETELEANGKQATGGPRRFHFKGRMRCVKVPYARMKRSGIGRRYPRNVPSILREGDEWMGEADRMLAVTAQGMPRDVRKFCLPFLHDIDLKACHPSILASKAKLFGISVPELDRYVANTDECRQQVMEMHNVTKDNAKTLFTLLLYGGSYKHRVEKWDRKGVQAQPIKAVQRLEKELKGLRDAVLAHEDLQHLVRPIMASERTRKSNFGDRTKTEEEALRSTWSQLTQNWEDQALGVIQKAVEAAGLVVHSLLFDGLMVYHNPEIDLAVAMDDAAKRIEAETGMTLALEEKELFDQARTDALV